MKKIVILIALIVYNYTTYAQDKWSVFENLIGNWQGTGEGFSGSSSTIHSSFQFTLNNNFIEVKNESVFKPTEKKPKGEVHQDWGLISYDKQRKVFVFRQFHIEGFVNQYVLNPEQSTAENLVFESEVIENFIPGGKARWTILIKSEGEIKTIFDLQMPGKEFVCYGTNKLTKDL